MDGYDLDGTLADVTFSGDLAAQFTRAPVIYTPHAPFAVITGRPHTMAAMRAATAAWLATHQPYAKSVHYVNHGSNQDTARAKAAIITRLHLATYTDNNRDVLAILATLLPPRVTLYAMSAAGQRTVYRGVDSAALAARWAPTL